MSIEVSEPLGSSVARPCYIAEWYRLELGVEALDRAVATIEACASSAGGQPPVKLLAMLAVPTDEVVFGIFAAESADRVADICHQAGRPAQRLTAAFDARRRANDERPDC